MDGSRLLFPEFVGPLGESGWLVFVRNSVSSSRAKPFSGSKRKERPTHMKQYFPQSTLTRGKLALAVVLAGLLVSGCRDSSTTQLSAREWPEALLTPIPGATFSLAEKHLPGAPGHNGSGSHQGFDFLNGSSGRPLASDEPIVAIADGIILRIDDANDSHGDEELAFYAEISGEPGFVGEFALDRLLGRQVWIRHDTGHISRYAHLSEVHPRLKPGDAVQQGQPIGLIGNSGLMSMTDQLDPPSRLHFELWSSDGSAFLGQDQTPLEIHRQLARHFGPETLPRYARRMVTSFEAGQEVARPYPPEDLPTIEFQVDPPESLPAGSAFAIPITWDNPEVRVQDFFATLERRPLGFIDAGNGAWALGVVPLQHAGEALNLGVGVIDVFGRTITGQSELPVASPRFAAEPREVELAELERYSEQNRQIEAARLAPVHRRALDLREALWSAPFQAPAAGNVVVTFGQPAVHGVLRPEYPLPGIRIEPENDNGEISAANAGVVALVDDLPIRGKTVALVHGGGVVTIYSGLNEIRVSAGEEVARGQTLAMVLTDSPGNRTVQIEIHVAGVPSNPVGWLDRMLPVVGSGSAN